MSEPPIDARAAIIEAMRSGDVRPEYDEAVDEMELVFPNSAGREGRAVFVAGQFYVRLDLATGAPLSIVIPAFTSWVERQRAARTAPTPMAHVGGHVSEPESETAVETAFRAVHMTVRYSSELPAVAAAS